MGESAKQFVVRSMDRIRELVEADDHLGLVDLGFKEGKFRGDEAFGEYRAALMDVGVDLMETRNRWFGKNADAAAAFRLLNDPNPGPGHPDAPTAGRAFDALSRRRRS